MNMHKKLKGGFTLVELLVVIVIIAALAGLTAPMVMRQRKKADQTEALNNARGLGMALFEFDVEYGRYPDTTTQPLVAERTGSELASAGGTSANAYFRQLLAANIANSEQIFYARTEFSVKPDDVFGTAAQALEAGEVGFGYIMRNATTAFSSAGNPARPIACAPLSFDGAVSTSTFDRDVYDGKAVLLRLDNSAVSVNVNQEGQAIINGRDLLATGTDTVWGTGSAPVIVAPEAR